MEFLRIFDHIYIRYRGERAKEAGEDVANNFLLPDDSWARRYTGKNP